MRTIEEIRSELGQCAKDSMTLTSDIEDSVKAFLLRFNALKKKAEELYLAIDNKLDGDENGKEMVSQ